MNNDQSAPKTCGLAIWSLVLGILSLFCFYIFTAIPGVICGHKALSRIKSSGGALKGEGLAIGGLVTGYLGIALSLFFIPLLAAIAIPNFVRARTTAQQNVCINNLRMIDGAKSQWAMEQHKQSTDTPTAQDLTPYLGGGSAHKLPVCPIDPAQTFATSYSINAVNTPPACKIMPAKHILP
jgi:hypothetical protein